MVHGSKVLVLDGSGSYLGMEKGCFVLRDREEKLIMYKKIDYLYKNLELETAKINFDFDNTNKTKLKDILKQIQNELTPVRIEVERNVMRYKHYHVSIWLTKPIKLYQALALRLLFGDHAERVRCDTIRLALNRTETFDYIGNRKYEVDINGNKTKKADYRRT